MINYRQHNFQYLQATRKIRSQYLQMSDKERIAQDIKEMNEYIETIKDEQEKVSMMCQSVKISLGLKVREGRKMDLNERKI